MIYVDCVRCLCKTCSRSRCRYQCIVCYPRCSGAARPNLFCADYSPLPRRQIYFYRKKYSFAQQLSRMTVADLIRLVGEIIDDTKRD